MGTAFEATVDENLLIAGQKEKQLAIEQVNHHLVPVTTCHGVSVVNVEICLLLKKMFSAEAAYA